MKNPPTIRLPGPSPTPWECVRPGPAGKSTKTEAPSASSPPQPRPTRPGLLPEFVAGAPGATGIRGLRPKAEPAGQRAPCSRGLGPPRVPAPLNVAQGPVGPLPPRSPGSRSCSSQRPEALGAAAPAPPRPSSGRGPEWAAPPCRPPGLGAPAAPSRGKRVPGPSPPPGPGVSKAFDRPQRPRLALTFRAGSKPAPTPAGLRPTLPPRAHTQPPAAARTAGRAQTTRRGPGAPCSPARSHARAALNPGERCPPRPAAVRTLPGALGRSSPSPCVPSTVLSEVSRIFLSSPVF
ncbi:basic proline-rich protein-like isoform X2 [Ailuropoda melanoleuca]|uniref:basic proline-rich protein-like isoform X2 n=2 Tax=Ailuropoda melanoleuca TaxID=9646 RepID=UPI001494B905|nr:basic proline-rich protein-like isoform X2 [Ailuropoda melanoleuca]XP_034519571.1 basic proline-rich protein-like isoform X2 [Ailuropoda melanoleuca]